MQEQPAKNGVIFWTSDLSEQHKEKAKPRYHLQAIPSTNMLSSIKNALSDQEPVILRGHSGEVHAVAFSPADQLLASGSFDGTIRLWDTKPLGAEVATMKGHSGTIITLAFSPDGATLASGSRDNSIKLWNIRSRSQIATMKEHEGWVYCVAFSHDGACLASGSEDRTIRLWDIKSRACISVLKEHSGDVHGVAFSTDSRILASGSSDRTIRLWNVAKQSTIAVLSGHDVGVRSLAFSRDGKYLASGSSDDHIRLWDGATGAHLATMHGHSQIIRSIDFSPNSKYLASASDDQTIRLWDVETRSVISILRGHKGHMNCTAFSPEGTRFASGSNDHTVRIWEVPMGEPNDSESATSTSNLIRLAQSATNSQQDTTTSASIQVPLNSDTTDSTILSASSVTTKLDAMTLTSPSVVLSNDITGSVSLEGNTPIGYGGFGELFLGVHKDRGKVALKKPRRILDEALIRRFLREVDLWCSVSHRYVLPCLGMCKVGLDVYVVSPYIENGDLLSCMARGQELNRSKLLYEVAEALAHLHHRGIVHGDVKAQNILLGDDGSALLCDFGLAKAFDTMVTSTESKGAGSVRWMAPELCLGEGRSMASDVYSLGITIAEILSGRTPFENISENLAVMFHVVYHDGRPPKEPMASPEGKPYATLWETAEKCWVKDVKTRPYMAQVLAMLFPLTRE